jgi:hypothetical protein
MPLNADAVQATHRVAVIEVDVGDPCPSTLVAQLDPSLTFVLSDASPAGYRWHELHVSHGRSDREWLVVASTLRMLAQARQDGRLADFRVVEGTRYLQSTEPAANANLSSVPAAMISPDGPHAAS